MIEVKTEECKLFIIKKNGELKKIKKMPGDRYYYDLFARSEDEFVIKENEKYPSAMGDFLASRLREEGNIILFFGSLNPVMKDEYNRLYMYLPFEYISTKQEEQLRKLLEVMFPVGTIQDKKVERNFDIIICSNRVIQLLKANSYIVDTGDGIEKKVNTVDKIMKIIEEAIHPEGYFKFDKNVELDDSIKCGFHLTAKSASSDGEYIENYEELENRDDLIRIKDEKALDRNNNRIVLDCVVDTEEKELYARLYISSTFFKDHNNDENKEKKQEEWFRLNLRLRGLRKFIAKFSKDGFKINTMLLADNEIIKLDTETIANYEKGDTDGEYDVIKTIINNIQNKINNNKREGRD